MRFKDGFYVRKLKISGLTFSRISFERREGKNIRSKSMELRFQFNGLDWKFIYDLEKFPRFSQWYLMLDKYLSLELSKKLRFKLLPVADWHLQLFKLIFRLIFRLLSKNLIFNAFSSRSFNSKR